MSDAKLLRIAQAFTELSQRSGLLSETRIAAEDIAARLFSTELANPQPKEDN